AWFFGILAPTSSFIPIRDPLFEHRMYLPLAAVIVLAVVGARAVLRRILRDRARRTTISVGLVIVIVTALGIRTVRRNADYRSPITIWNDVIDQHPNNSRAHYSLGYLLTMQGRHEEAVPELRTALAIRPDYQEAIRLEPRYFVAHNNLANAYQRLGKLEDAAGAYRVALQLHADYPEARSNLAGVLSQMGLLEEAVQQYRAALQLVPHDPVVHSNLGVALARQGKLDEAVAQFRAAIRIAPEDMEAQINLGLALTRQGKIAEAISVYRAVLQIDPQNPRARAALDELIGERGQPKPP
ncbi:MAG: tetratricopeptide repeat protein, partial [Planctomycetes bacterium]|nr:tetratricopeptide repeat protein [Planctomycetota bacterium]